MGSVEQVFGVIALIAAPARQADEAVEVMREEFCASIGTSDPTAELSAVALIGGLRDAVYAGRFGLWVDYNDAPTINDQTQDLIETRVGVANPSTATFYRYDGEDVAEGLLGFDDWLQADHEAKRQQLIDDGDSEQRADKILENYRMVEFETGADYALSIVHPNNGIDELVKALKTIGINARRPAAVTLEKPEDETYNLGELIWDHLTSHHGYQDHSKLVGKKLNGSLSRVFDDQHVLVAGISPFKSGPSEGAYGHLSFRLVRSDINLLGAEILRFPAYAPTISEDDVGRFLDRPDSRWKNFEQTRQNVIDYLDEWAPKLESICDIEFIEAQLAQPLSDGQLDDFRWLTVLVNRMLNGWNPETDDPILNDRYSRVVEAASPESSRLTQMHRDIAAIRDWISNNPNGLR